MDEHSHKILVVLVFTTAIHQVIAQAVSLQQIAITQHWNMMSALLFFKNLWTCHYKFGAYPWSYEKVVGYMKNLFFGSFLEKLFQQSTR
jgi:hypothetical protein